MFESVRPQQLSNATSLLPTYEGTQNAIKNTTNSIIERVQAGFNKTQNAASQLKEKIENATPRQVALMTAAAAVTSIALTLFILRKAPQKEIFALPQAQHPETLALEASKTPTFHASNWTNFSQTCSGDEAPTFIPTTEAPILAAPNKTLDVQNNVSETALTTQISALESVCDSIEPRLTYSTSSWIHGIKNYTWDLSPLEGEAAHSKVKEVCQAILALESSITLSTANMTAPTASFTIPLAKLLETAKKSTEDKEEFCRVAKHMLNSKLTNGLSFKDVISRVYDGEHLASEITSFCKN